MITIKSTHFGEIEISGENAPAAADWLTQEIANASKAEEILAHKQAMRDFGVTVQATNSHIKDTDKVIHSLL